ncbi:MAG TPA: TIGR03087 family PEP-CTERM/XrtA system glycosyltransferase, partial [Methylomirabilota bacterium]|nr:TIGR03087 family PEP-CTERM/XrtA system glycosyltransferase [Methylomirabilota bacterium]
QELKRYCHELHVGRIGSLGGWGRFGLYGLTPAPATFGYFYSPGLGRMVARLLDRRGFEAVLVHCSSMGPYVAGHAACRKVMDFGDADSEKWLEYGRRAPFPLSLAYRLEGRKVRRYERWLGERFDACSVNVSREREVLSAYIRTPIHVIPNGVDLDYFRPRGEPGRHHPSRLIFTGNMSYKPNVDAVRHFVGEVLPRIRRELPQVELYVVGMDPTPAVRRLADGARLVVTGRVADVRPYFESATVAVAPLRIARGLQNKVLEAMAMRVPVVASPEAALGIEAQPDRDLLVADGPAAFARAVLRLLRDPWARERYAAAGRACVEQQHNWDRLLARLEELVVGKSAERKSARLLRHPSGGGTA